MHFTRPIVAKAGRNARRPILSRCLPHAAQRFATGRDERPALSLWALAASLALAIAALAGPARAAGGPTLNSKAPAFNGKRAYHYTAKVTAFGPRPPGSKAHARLLHWLEHQLQGIHWDTQKFTAHTPDGAIPMTNVIAHFKGTKPGVIVISGHYDTLSHRPHFVGANDGGSSTGILLALAKHFHAHPPQGPSIWIAWLDGEEAIRKWQGHDHTYGSRHLARLWHADGQAKRIRAVINLDMIGDRHLGVARDLSSTRWLMNLVCARARTIGAGAHFCNYSMGVSDDDTEFRAVGLPAVDIIDFHYGPNNSYWHTPKDTMDKLAPESFHIVGSVTLSVIHALAHGAGPGGHSGTKSHR